MRIFSPSLEGLSAYRSQPVRFDYWGGNQSRATTSTPYMVSARVRSSLCDLADTLPQDNVDITRRPWTGPTRPEMMPIVWFQLYGVTRTHPNGHSDVEAGPSTLVALPIPYVNPPTSQPSGGTSKTTAYAKKKKRATERGGASVSIFRCSHLPRVTEWSFSVRSPSGPSFPLVKEHPAPGVCGRRRMAIGCVSGCIKGRCSQGLRP